MQVTGSSASIFGVVLTISISTFLLSYVIAIPAAVRLRTRFPDVARARSGCRPATRGSASSAACASRGSLLGSWVAVFPAPWSACSASTTTSSRPGASARPLRAVHRRHARGAGHPRCRRLSAGPAVRAGVGRRPTRSARRDGGSVTAHCNAGRGHHRDCSGSTRMRRRPDVTLTQLRYFVKAATLLA